MKNMIDMVPYRGSGFTRVYRRQRGRSRSRGRGVMYKRALVAINHCEQTMVTVGGTELATTMFTGLDGPTNRSTHVPAGSVVKGVFIRLFATDGTPVNGKHQCALTWRPAAMVFQGGFFAGWYSATDPLTSVALEARRSAMQRNPHTLVTVTGVSGPPRMYCSWKGNRIIRDGDDIVLHQLDAGATNWYAECIIKYVA